MSKIYSLSEIQEKLLPVFRALPIERAILFGSYAKGEAHEKSDVDILIDSKGQIRGIDFFGVIADIEDALSIDVDLFDTTHLIEGGRVQQEINNTGVLIYERI